MKQKIAFYIELYKYSSVLNNFNLDDGNPGIGGTQYLFLLTVKYLNKLNGSDYAVLLTDGDIKINDSEIPIFVVKSARDAVYFCEKESIKKLVFNANVASQQPNDLFNSNSISFILWAHNTLNYRGQQVASIKNSIKRIVCVSYNQMINMEDSPCFHKCVYINNVITENFYERSFLTDYTKNAVVYIGALFPQKGVHNLLDIWKLVEERVSNAELYIIGGAKIWNTDVFSEGYGGADSFYGRIIKSRINKLSKPSNVHFLGALDWNRINEIIKTFKIGIVNPSYYYRDETFCMSALELECHGIPVISRQRHDGLNATILNGETGFLEKSNLEIANAVIRILNNSKLNRKLGANARNFASSFFIDQEVLKWTNILELSTQKKTRRKYRFISKDSILLFHDFILKLIYLVRSKKIFYVLRKSIKRRMFKNKQSKNHPGF